MAIDFDADGLLDSDRIGLMGGLFEHGGEAKELAGRRLSPAERLAFVLHDNVRRALR